MRVQKLCLLCIFVFCSGRIAASRNAPNGKMSKSANRNHKPNVKNEPSIGTATMEKDGTIVLTMNIGMTLLRYPKSHEKYTYILEHLDGLNPGETKLVAPFPEH